MFEDAANALDNISTMRDLARNYYKLEAKILLVEKEAEEEGEESYDRVENTWTLLVHKDSTWQDFVGSVTNLVKLAKVIYHTYCFNIIEGLRFIPMRVGNMNIS